MECPKTRFNCPKCGLERDAYFWWEEAVSVNCDGCSFALTFVMHQTQTCTVNGEDVRILFSVKGREGGDTYHIGYTLLTGLWGLGRAPARTGLTMNPWLFLRLRHAL